MKRIVFSIIFCILGAALLIGGGIFAAYQHDYNTAHFDRYRTVAVYKVTDDSIYTKEAELLSEAERRIRFPQYLDGDSHHNISPDFFYCYDRIDCACQDYVDCIAFKYMGNADLDFTTDITKDRLTITFTGTGYPENSEPEPLSRTYIFDIEGIGADKLPILINRAEFIGY